jgi:hypothetical protein
MPPRYRTPLKIPISALGKTLIRTPTGIPVKLQSEFRNLLRAGRRTNHPRNAEQPSSARTFCGAQQLVLSNKLASVTNKSEPVALAQSVRFLCA